MQRLQGGALSILGGSIRGKNQGFLLLQALFISLHTALAKARPPLSAKIRHAPVALLQKVRHGHFCALAVVYIHPADIMVRRFGLAQHHAGKISQLFQQRGLYRGGWQNQSVHFTLQHQLFDTAHAARMLGSVCQNYMIAALLRHLLHRKQAAVEKHVAEGFRILRVHHHADGAALAVGQAAGQAVGVIIQLTHGGIDFFACFLHHGCLAVEHTRHRG